MNWRQSNGEAVTVESSVPVYCPETGEDGRVDVLRDQRFGRISFGPVVYQEYDHEFNEDGSLTSDPKRRVIDREPTFG